METNNHDKLSTLFQERAELTIGLAKAEDDHQKASYENYNRSEVYRNAVLYVATSKGLDVNELGDVIRANGISNDDMAMLFNLSNELIESYDKVNMARAAVESHELSLSHVNDRINYLTENHLKKEGDVSTFGNQQSSQLPPGSVSSGSNHKQCRHIPPGSPPETSCAQCKPMPPGSNPKPNPMPGSQYNIYVPAYQLYIPKE